MVAATRVDTGTVLAFDFGARKIGVAIGNTLVRVANPLTTIRGESNSERFTAIGALVSEWQPQTLVVGRPLYADGSAHAITAQAERFARALEGRFRLPVVRVDERYTTQIADAQLREAGIRGAARSGSRDAVAAQLILQSWLDDTRGEGRRDAP